ncbi:hypothetical protein C2845_PM07G09910 [Panicum miliaceum]|uniref:Uncharacterized protein n=1 Tax=Panicum miliaceum TaxID=4540 RepID=A0A3L6SM29_PANMI|nr:hypothetical protein C2845_PM07G09910 [Panicum miliaceum]
MDGVEGLMRNLQLSVVEKKGLRIGSKGKATEANGDQVQALGKVSSEKLIHAEMVEQALGRVWCPIKGIECRSLGENKFLIIFLQESGKRKALDEGSWMISKDLLVAADVDRRKALDEIEFVLVPIWIQIMNLPIGLMNNDTGMTIGQEVGELMMMDLEDGDVPICCFLRVRVRLDIRKLLMRGVTVEDGEGYVLFSSRRGRFNNLTNLCVSSLNGGDLKGRLGGVVDGDPILRWVKDDLMNQVVNGYQMAHAALRHRGRRVVMMEGREVEERRGRKMR